MSAISLAVLMACAQWALWEFGSRQICHNRITGEHKIVYGPGAAFADGPFQKLLPHPDNPDVALLLGPGDPESAAVHRLDECGALTPTPVLRGGIEDYDVRTLWPDEDQESPLWTSELQAAFDTLVLDVSWGAALHMQFTRHFAPTLVGDKPVSLWLDFGRVSDYVF